MRCQRVHAHTIPSLTHTCSGAFNCLFANDNAADVAGQSCSANPRASTTVTTLTSTRVIFVQLGGYNGVDITSGLSWLYVPPSFSATSTRSRTKTATRTRTRSASKKKKA